MLEPDGGFVRSIALAVLVERSNRISKGAGSVLSYLVDVAGGIGAHKSDDPKLPGIVGPKDLESRFIVRSVYPIQGDYGGSSFILA